jgi:hypothetical protein
MVTSYNLNTTSSKSSKADDINRLENKVIDLEVASKTPSPTIDPSVRVILIGHSMGGIVAAETVLSIINDQPIKQSNASTKSKGSYDDAPDLPFMFPSILGLLAFDTPYLGLSPGVIAHNAESHYQTARNAYSVYNTVSSAFGLGGASSGAASKAVDASKALPAAAPSANDPDVAAVPAWQKWGRYTMYAGGAAALLAGGAAVYAKRAELSEGWNWATSHLAFINCLARGAELEHRVADITELSERGGFGFQNMFTQLGAGAGTLTWKDDSSESGGTLRDTGEQQTGTAAAGGKDSWAHALVGSQRTFCLLPKTGSEKRGFFVPTLNDKANSEIVAHMGMFTPKDNPGYYAMSEAAKSTITKWVSSTWFVDDSLADEEEEEPFKPRTMFERQRDDSEEPEEIQKPRDETPELIKLDEAPREETPEIVERKELEGNPWA